MLENPVVTYLGSVAGYAGTVVNTYIRYIFRNYHTKPWKHVHVMRYVEGRCRV